MSEAQEIELGRKMHPQILQKYGRYDDEQLQQYVNDGRPAHRRARVIGPNLQYTFTVLDSDEVNAFALPGGYVYITRGIMAYLNSEAELAAVLGHEIGHVTARHSVRQQTGATAAGVGAMVVGILTGSGDLANVAGMAGNALISGYGRDMELEADELGAEYLNRIGYEPEAMIDVVRLLKNQEMFEMQMARQENRQPRVYHGVFASHPTTTRACRRSSRPRARSRTPTIRPPNRDLYLARIDGLPVGDSRAQGVVRGSRFYHADLGITLAFPSGWIVDNQPTKVLAYPAGQGRDDGGVGPGAAAGHGAEGVPRPAAAGHADDGRGSRSRSTGSMAIGPIVRSTGLPWGTQGPAAVAVVYYNGLAYIFQGGTRQAAGMSAASSPCSCRASRPSAACATTSSPPPNQTASRSSRPAPSTTIAATGAEIAAAEVSGRADCGC